MTSKSYLKKVTNLNIIDVYESIDLDNDTQNDLSKDKYKIMTYTWTQFVLY